MAASRQWSGPGHLFVAQRDIQHLYVDAWLLPTDRYGSVVQGWYVDDTVLAGRVDRWGATGNWPPRDGSPVGVLPGGAPEEPLVVLADAAAGGGTDATTHVATIRQMINLVRMHRSDDTRLIIAVPALGTGAGGGFDVGGGLLAAFVPLLQALASSEQVDIVLGLRNDDTAAAVRAIRRSRVDIDWWPALDSGDLEAAIRVGERAVLGELTLFTGAGTGRAAGLPDWNDLLTILELKAGLDPERLKDASFLDRATIVARKLDDTAMRVEISRLLQWSRYAVQHALLANLPVAEAVTLNYDRLLEQAASDCGQSFAVLPYEPAEGRWLLKLHGDLGTERQNDIVLTRSDYLSTASHRATLTGLVQAS